MNNVRKKICIPIMVALVWTVVGCSPPTSFGAGAQNPASSGDGTVISRNVPAYASSGHAPDANDDSYDSYWWSTTTQAWLAYDLSGVPKATRAKVLLVWYNSSYNYDNTVIRSDAYNVPQDYTIDVNPAPGGGNPPDSGWVTRLTVHGNHYHSRQHVFDLQGANWVRINVTGVDGSIGNVSVRINMDIYPLSYAQANDFMFYGDSITAGSTGNNTLNGTEGIAMLIHHQRPHQFPIQEAGGIGFLTAGDGAKYLPTWLPLFPGKYVVLSYGTNDALGCDDPGDFWNHYVAMVQDVLKAGKIPIIPHIPWGKNPNLPLCAPPLNAKIDALYKTYPQIIKGPDLWGYFQSHQNLISEDGVHPSEAGIAGYRQQWVDALLKTVYATA